MNVTGQIWKLIKLIELMELNKLIEFIEWDWMLYESNESLISYPSVTCGLSLYGLSGVRFLLKWYFSQLSQ